MPKHAHPSATVAYTEHYKTLCKTAWYAAGRPDKAPQIKEIIPEDDFGRKPDPHTITLWRNEFMWDAWADTLDAEAERIVEDELINQRLIMLKKQAAVGAELQAKGIDHLREFGFDTSASAVSAIKLGVDVERTARGISDRLAKLAKMSDEELSEETQKLLDMAMESGEVIDMADVEDLEEDVEDNSAS